MIGFGSGATRMSHGFRTVGQAIDIDVLRIDQQLAGPERQYRRVDVHRVGAAAFDLVDAILFAEVTPQPFDAGSALVTLLRVTNRSRPQRKKSAASNTGSNSVRM